MGTSPAAFAATTRQVMAGGRPAGHVADHAPFLNNVKLANPALARAREAEWLHRFDPARWPRPAPTRSRRARLTGRIAAPPSTH